MWVSVPMLTDWRQRMVAGGAALASAASFAAASKLFRDLFFCFQLGTTFKKLALFSRVTTPPRGNCTAVAPEPPALSSRAVRRLSDAQLTVHRARRRSRGIFGA
jgi:hypothetical protein